MTSYRSLALLILSCVACAGCSRQGASSGTTTATTSAEADHTHERGKMMIADAGKYHALLTAHLSPEGNELDIFFETADDKKSQPVSLPLLSFKAMLRKADETEYREVQFDCAPPQERPAGEKPGTCSHFVAKTAWIQPDDNLTVVCNLIVQRNEIGLTPPASFCYLVSL